MTEADAELRGAAAGNGAAPRERPAPASRTAAAPDPSERHEAVAEAVRAAVAPGAVPFVGVFDRVASTNDLLRAAAADAVPGTFPGPFPGSPPNSPAGVSAVVVAFEQSAGRGRFGRRWVSPPGGLYLSLLVSAPATASPGAADRPREGAPGTGAFALLPVAAGLAAAEAVEAVSGFGVELRWPNDLDWEGGKLAGVLAETGFPVGPRNARPRKLPYDPGPELAIVGFGVNLTPVELRPGPEEPPPLRPPAHLPGGTDPARLAGALTASFENAFRLAATDPAALAARWESRSPSARDARCRVRLRAGGAAEGRTDGLAADGGLRVRLASGGAAVIHASDALSFAPAGLASR